MPLENIIKKIEEENRNKARQILTEAENKKKEIISSAQTKAEKITEEMMKKASQKFQKDKNSALALATLQARKNILGFKQSVISKVYDEILGDLQALSIEDYQSLIENILVKNAAGDEEIIIASSYKDKITKEFIQRVNKKLTSQGKKGNLTLSAQKRDLRGGIVLHKGKVEINYSFDNLVKNLRDDTEAEIVKILFEDL